MADDRRFPIQGGLTVSWAAAETAYRAYASKYGTTQSLERLAERGGFGLIEFGQLVLEGRGRSAERAFALARSTSGRELAGLLADADVRPAAGGSHA